MSNLIQIDRQFELSGWGTFGILTMPGYSCHTLERPWLGNQPFISCIPPNDTENDKDIYKLREGFFNRGGYPTVEVVDVKGRTHIKFHKGNTVTDTQGCILLGTDLDVIVNNSSGGALGLTFSNDAFAEFMQAWRQVPIEGMRITPPVVWL